MNLVTEYCFYRPITYDKDKYLLETNLKYMILRNKKNNEIIIKGDNIWMVKQINDNEFIAITYEIHKKSEVTFYHVEHNELNGENRIIFRNQYKYKRLIDNHREINSIYIMDSYFQTTLYNPNTRKALTLENSIIYNEVYSNCDEDISYIPAKVKVILNNEYSDELIILINMNTLEFEEFYSTKQKKEFDINKLENIEFITAYNQIIENKIIDYLKKLELEEKYLKETENNKALNYLVKKKLKI